MSPRNTSNSARERRRKTEAILNAAERLFSRKGYHQTTMEEVAKEAALSVGTLYNEFQDKERLYAQVSLRIGHAVLKRLRPLEACEDPEQAIQDLIRLLLHNYVHDRLFFQPFCFPAYLRIKPEPEQLGEEVNALYCEYVALVDAIFDRCRACAGQGHRSPVKMAMYVEGIITAFMGYWSGPVPSDQLTKVAQEVGNMLLRGLSIPFGLPEDSEELETAETRVSYITRYDLERLNELIKVVRTFGRDDSLPHVEALEALLAHARITNPREVPPDVVTMNSRVRLQNVPLNTEQVVTLVFPKDADPGPDNVSILSPVGVGMFGRRVGDVFSCAEEGDETRYQVSAILYQPEAAGDYDL